ncbi:Alpha-D-kanosaminyltransferase [Microbulbifer aggregans]|uniref:Alpha-D-kanosaminyltransferase n=1 Tax=Microbulbifer aggregans TaxID=1769779 RepID=A0A1C9W9F5_9GAMM|nr:glycosyltransferase [Microbulbifer aggregans]AOS97770.1 Alpha-D-kanosaminyltransferase [Microbulbifer aggregans]
MDTKAVQCYRTFFPESQGGLEQVVLEIARGGGGEVLTLSDRGASSGEYSGVRYRTARRWFSVASCCVGPGLFLEVLKNSSGVLHFHFPWPFGDLVYAVAGRSRPLVITYHSDIVRQRWLGSLYRPLMHWFLRRADRIVATSANYVESSDVLRAYRDKVEVIPLGIAEGLYPSLERSCVESVKAKYGTDFMLFVGVLRYYKGLEFLIRAAAGRPYPIVIAGKGPEEERLRELASQLGAKNVHFTGFVDDDEKMALMQLCRAVVLPSHLRSEAFGVTLIEGLMSSKPLVSCELGTGTSYVNVHGQTGFVVQPASPKSLRQALDRLWESPDLAERMGRAGRLRYEALFTGERMVRAYIDLYCRVLRERGLGV